MSVAADPETVAPGPQQVVNWRWMLSFSLALLGVSAGWFGPIQILLAAQAERIAATSTGGNKEGMLALVTGLGATASMIVNPIWGAISDRTRSRWGRRIPILVAGTLLGSLGLVWLSFAADLPSMIAGWVIVQLGLNGPFAALGATIADRVPERQRGLVGSLYGIAQVIGVVLGTAVAVALGEGSLGYLAIAIAVPMLVASFAVIHREPVRNEPGPSRPDTSRERAPKALRGGLRGLRPTAAFAWAWTIRFLLNTASSLTTLYLYYYLADAVAVADPGTWVLVLTVLNVAVTALAAAVCGPLSDRQERRRIFVVISAIVSAAAAGLMAFVPQLPVVLVAASIAGLGWGVFMAVDMAILTKVLPSSDSNATMLGIGNIASALPQVVAPALAATLVRSLGGYVSLYGVAAAICLLALICVPRLRGVR